MSHTPGPWKAGYFGGQCHVPEHVAARHHPGAKSGCVYDRTFYPMTVSADGQVSSVGIVSESGAEVVSTSYDELKISPADALLIAAAPDLLAALQKIVDGEMECGCEHDDEHCCAKSRDFHCPFCIAALAIAKVEAQ